MELANESASSDEGAVADEGVSKSCEITAGDEPSDSAAGTPIEPTSAESPLDEPEDPVEAAVIFKRRSSSEAIDEEALDVLRASDVDTPETEVCLTRGSFGTVEVEQGRVDEDAPARTELRDAKLEATRKEVRAKAGRMVATVSKAPTGPSLSGSVKELSETLFHLVRCERHSSTPLEIKRIEDCMIYLKRYQRQLRIILESTAGTNSVCTATLTLQLPLQGQYRHHQKGALHLILTFWYKKFIGCCVHLIRENAFGLVDQSLFKLQDSTRVVYSYTCPHGVPPMYTGRLLYYSSTPLLQYCTNTLPRGSRESRFG